LWKQARTRHRRCQQTYTAAAGAVIGFQVSTEAIEMRSDSEATPCHHVVNSSTSSSSRRLTSTCRTVALIVINLLLSAHSHLSTPVCTLAMQYCLFWRANRL